MKKIIALLLISLSTLFCSANIENDKKEKRETLVKTFLLLQLIQNLNLLTAYELSECTNYSGTLNPFYLTDAYYFKFVNDKKQYKNIIIGDSTMDISVRYNGFIDSSVTQGVPIGGNKMCDMITQLPAINTTSPDVIIVSTTGGNDMLSQIQNDSVVRTGELLILRLKEKFPNAKLVMVAIHPTLVAYGNTNKGYVNLNIKAKLEQIYPVGQRCWIEPQLLFTGVTTEGNAAQTSDMIKDDNIHYNQAMSFKIKNKIQTDCGFTF